MEALLCLPSTVCSSRIGEKQGKARVNVHGDSVVAEKVRGDGWRKRHDQVKRRIVPLKKWAGIETQCEVLNLFSSLIPQEGVVGPAPEKLLSFPSLRHWVFGV